MRDRDLLDTLTEKELLALRLKDLHFNLKTSWVQAPINQVLEELKMKGIPFKPHFWLAEDWYCPDGITGVAVPFYLMSPRLTRLEKRFNRRAEGASYNEALKIIRHEVGHAIDNAYFLRRRRRRQALFGKSGQPYPERYEAHCDSTDFVQHLGDNYAQAHPDEDWAETFAVWLNPKSRWKQKYRGTKALEKLLYMDELMGSMKGVKPIKINRKRVDALSTHKQTLAAYWSEKKELRFSHHQAMEIDLKKIFQAKGSTSLSRLIKAQKRSLGPKIAKKTKVQHYKITGLLNELELCVRHRRMEVEGSEQEVQVSLIKLLEKKSRLYIRKGFHKVSM